MSGLLIPAILCLAGTAALCRGKPVYSTLTAGIRQGMQTVLTVFPPVAAILTAAYLFRASGALDALECLLSPLLLKLGIPPETAGLLLLRPLSGSGALAAASELLERFGPDSRIGLTAAVMLGSSETTFYVLSVYFGAAEVKKTRHALPAALVGDVVGAVAAAWFVNRIH